MSVNVLSYSTTNVTTSSYVTLITSLSSTVGNMQITDTSGQLLKLAYGPVGSEVDFAIVPVSGSIYITNLYILPGARISIKAINATANTGFNTIAYF